jgi:hypothetical protein
MKFDNDIMHCQFCPQTYSNYNNFELQATAYRTAPLTFTFSITYDFALCERYCTVYIPLYHRCNWGP